MWEHYKTSADHVSAKSLIFLYLNISWLIVEFYHLNYLAFYQVKYISKADFQLL